MGVQVTTVIGILGNATAVLLFLSPIKTFVRICKNKSTEEFSGVPYVSTLFNCMLWLLYGLPFVKPNRTVVLTINSFGFVVECVYIAIFLTYAATTKSRRKTFQYLAAVVLFVVALALIVLLGIHKKDTRALVVGCLCAVLNVVMNISPLSIMRLVIKTRSVEYMPFLLSLMVLINSVMWFAYALLERDIFVLIPNVLGLAAGIAQLGLYGWYRNATPVAITNKIPTSSVDGITNDVESNIELQQSRHSNTASEV